MTEQEKREWFRHTDWLREAIWRWEVYRKPSPTWDHEHCVFCDRVIAEPSASRQGVLHEAWTTNFVHPEGDAGYEWVCPSCFEQLRETFAWGVEGQAGPAA